METGVIVILVVAVVAVIALIGVLTWRKRQSQALQERFGDEYERTVERTGDERAAERDLRAREERRKKLDIRPLPPETRQRYLEDWRTVQGRFVDAPDAAVKDAHALVTNVMRDRGYPMEDFEQRAADISVDHPEVVEDYRAAGRITAASERGHAGTEELRQAMVHFRALFDRLLDASTHSEPMEDRS
jgi:hypothetical protein